MVEGCEISSRKPAYLEAGIAGQLLGLKQSLAFESCFGLADASERVP